MIECYKSRKMASTARHVKKTRPSHFIHVLAVLWGDSLTLTAPNMKDSLDINLTTADTKAVKVEVLEAPEELTLQDYGDEAAAWLEKATDISKCRLI